MLLRRIELLHRNRGWFWCGMPVLRFLWTPMRTSWWIRTTAGRSTGFFVMRRAMGHRRRALSTFPVSRTTATPWMAIPRLSSSCIYNKDVLKITRKRQFWNKSIESINQSITVSIRLIYQSIKQSVNQSIDLTAERTIKRTIKQWNWSITWLFTTQFGRWRPTPGALLAFFFTMMSVSMVSVMTFRFRGMRNFFHQNTPNISSHWLQFHHLR